MCNYSHPVFFDSPKCIDYKLVTLCQNKAGPELGSDGVNSPSEISVGVRAGSANRGELTRDNGAPAEFGWFNAQLSGHHYLGVGRSVGDYLHQVVCGRATPSALLGVGSGVLAVEGSRPAARLDCAATRGACLEPRTRFRALPGGTRSADAPNKARSSNRQVSQRTLLHSARRRRGARRSSAGKDRRLGSLGWSPPSVRRSRCRSGTIP